LTSAPHFSNRSTALAFPASAAHDIGVSRQSLADSLTFAPQLNQALTNIGFVSVRSLVQWGSAVKLSGAIRVCCCERRRSVEHRQRCLSWRFRINSITLSTSFIT
jgi:hypothetical protein